MSFNKFLRRQESQHRKSQKLKKNNNNDPQAKQEVKAKIKSKHSIFLSLLKN